MKKNESTSTARAKFVQETINKRPTGTKVESVVTEIADKLFLSPFTIWKDYQKVIPVVPEHAKQSGRNKY